MPNNVKSCKKINEKAQTAKFTVFAREINSAVLKTWKTRQTKTWITQNFQILYPIQGSTMWKLMSWAIQKCGTFLDLAVFKVELLAAEVGSKLKKNDIKAAFKKKARQSSMRILDPGNSRESQLHFFSLNHEKWFFKVSISSRNTRITRCNLVLVSKYENGHIIISISSRQVRARKMILDLV